MGAQLQKRKNALDTNGAAAKSAKGVSLVAFYVREGQRGGE